MVSCNLRPLQGCEQIMQNNELPFPSIDLNTYDLDYLLETPLFDNFDLDPSDLDYLLETPLFDNFDRELEQIPSCSNFLFDCAVDQGHQVEKELKPIPAVSNVERESMMNDEDHMVFDSNGFPVQEKVPRYHLIPKEQHMRHLRGAIDCASKNMTMPRKDTDGQYIMSVDVNMSSAPMQGEMDVTVSPESRKNLRVLIPGDLKSYKDAMEKLCESMERSAKSRDLIKQLPIYSLAKTNSSRSISSGGQSTVFPSRKGPARSSKRSFVCQKSGRDLIWRAKFRSFNGDGCDTSPYASRRPKVDVPHSDLNSFYQTMARYRPRGDVQHLAQNSFDESITLDRAMSRHLVKQLSGHSRSKIEVLPHKKWKPEHAPPKL